MKWTAAALLLWLVLFALLSTTAQAQERKKNRSKKNKNNRKKKNKNKNNKFDTKWKEQEQGRGEGYCKTAFFIDDDGKGLSSVRFPANEAKTQKTTWDGSWGGDVGSGEAISIAATSKHIYALVDEGDLYKVQLDADRERFTVTPLDNFTVVDMAAITVNKQNKIYGISYAGDIYKINPVTGRETKLATTATVIPDILDVGYFAGSIYAVDGTNLYRIDPRTGAVQDLGRVPYPKSLRQKKKPSPTLSGIISNNRGIAFVYDKAGSPYVTLRYKRKDMNKDKKNKKNKKNKNKDKDKDKNDSYDDPDIKSKSKSKSQDEKEGKNKNTTNKNKNKTTKNQNNKTKNKEHDDNDDGDGDSDTKEEWKEYYKNKNKNKNKTKNNNNKYDDDPDAKSFSKSKSGDEGTNLYKAKYKTKSSKNKTDDNSDGESVSNKNENRKKNRNKNDDDDVTMQYTDNGLTRKCKVYQSKRESKSKSKSNDEASYKTINCTTKRRKLQDTMLYGRTKAKVKNTRLNFPASGAFFCGY